MFIESHLLLEFSLHYSIFVFAHAANALFPLFLIRSIPCWVRQGWGRSAGVLRRCGCRRFVRRCEAQGVGPCPWCHSWWAVLQHFHGPAGGPLPGEWSHPENAGARKREMREKIEEGNWWWHKEMGNAGKEVRKLNIVFEVMKNNILSADTVKYLTSDCKIIFYKSTLIYILYTQECSIIKHYLLFITLYFNIWS